LVPHLEERLQRDIDRIRDRVREMADLAVRSLEDSINSLATGDRKLAYAAILRDSRIDELETVIDNMCVEFMVRHIPVAKNLRFAHSVAKIVLELERIGDYAETINRQAILLSRASFTPSLDPYAELARVAVEMVRQAVRAFLDEDLELANRTRALDAQANRLHQDIYSTLLRERPQSSEDLVTLFSLLSVANRFERVADQAVNVCEEVFYLVTGEIVKHQLLRDLKVLFVSTANSCRSLMAEGIGRAIAGKRVEFTSAGIDAAPPDPRAVEFLAKKNIDVSGHQAKTLDDIGDLTHFKAVVAIGPEAAKAIPKMKVGFRTVLAEWPVANPAERAANEPVDEDDYAAVFDELVDRVSELVRSLHGTVTPQAGVRKHA
jgi:phosphate transport system protein